MLSDKGNIPVSYFYRSQGYGFSIEQVFSDIRSELPKCIQQSEFYCPQRFATPSAICENIKCARKYSTQINHITGDIYYLSIGLPRKGQILTIHDSGHIDTLLGFRRFIYRLLWFAIPVKRAEASVFISEYSRRELEQHLGRKVQRSRVIPDPVSRQFVFSPKNFSQDRTKVLALGTKHNKNLVRLCQALHGLDIELRIIGQLRSEHLHALQEHKIRYSNDANLSPEKIIKEYQQCDIVSLVSTHEGFGLPVVEGQATGRVVIASNVCSIPEVAQDSACLLDPYNVEAMRTAFQKVISDSAYRGDLIERGRKNAKRFHPSTVARAYFELYQEVMHNS